MCYGTITETWMVKGIQSKCMQIKRSYLNDAHQPFSTINSISLWHLIVQVENNSEIN